MRWRSLLMGRQASREANNMATDINNLLGLPAHLVVAKRTEADILASVRAAMASREESADSQPGTQPTTEVK